MEYLRSQALLMLWIGLSSILVYSTLLTSGSLRIFIAATGLISITASLILFKSKYPSAKLEFDERTKFIEEKSCKNALLSVTLTLAFSSLISNYIDINSTALLLTNLLVVLFSLASSFIYYTSKY